MSKQTKFKKYSIFGIEIDAITIPQAVDYIVELASDAGSMAEYVTKPYVEFLDPAYQNPAIRDLLNQSKLCIPDGVALNWAATYLYGGRHNLSRWLGTLMQIILRPASTHKLLPGRAGGTNLAWPLLESISRHKLRIFIIGTPDGGRGDLGKTAEAIKRRLPDINIVGQYGGYFPPGDEDELVHLLQDARPDLVLVGMGFPRQEQLMDRLTKRLAHGILIGEGGTFDYRSFGGSAPKAPGWMQQLGLEWLWRLILEPTRLRRQLAIPRFMWRVYLEGRSQR